MESARRRHWIQGEIANAITHSGLLGLVELVEVLGEAIGAPDYPERTSHEIRSDPPEDLLRSRIS